MTESQPKASFEDVVEVLTSEKPQAVIADFRVLLTHSELKSMKEGASEPAFQTLQSIGHDGDQVTWVRTEFRMWSKVQPNSEKANAEIATFCFALGIAYAFEGTASELARTYFAKINGVTHSWPYFRTFMHAASTQMGLSVPGVLPLLPPEQAGRLAGYEVTPEASAKASPSSSKSEADSPRLKRRRAPSRPATRRSGRG